MVERGGELILCAPVDCPLETVMQVAREKQPWVYTKLAPKELLRWPTRVQEFVSGESCYYLGRTYRLLLSRSKWLNFTEEVFHIC